MAIKVNGTTVINDSRALQNVASVDATTVAAMGAAGVGGASKLITNYTALTGGSTYSFSLTAGYKEYYIAIHDLVSNHVGALAELCGRFTNSSNSAITTGYHYKFFNNSQNGAGSDVNRIIFYDNVFNNSSYVGRMDLLIKITNPQTSSLPTMTSFTAISRAFTTSLESIVQGASTRTTKEVNNSFFLFINGSTFASNGGYSMWGVDY